MTRRYFRIVDHFDIHWSYNSAKKQLRDGEWVETRCPSHGWGPTTSDGGCLACYRQDRGLTEEKE